MIDLRGQFLVGMSEHVFTLKSFPDCLKRDFDDCKSVSFQFSKQVVRFLISTCYFADVDSLSAENVIADLLSCPISI